jgi:hypothetical protein
LIFSPNTGAEDLTGTLGQEDQGVERTTPDRDEVPIALEPPLPREQ